MLSGVAAFLVAIEIAAVGRRREGWYSGEEYQEVSMAFRKLAISLPEEVLSDVDEAARRAQLSRSAYIARVLSSLARARSDAAITRRVNELLAEDRRMIAEDRATAAAFLRGRVNEGTEW